MLTSLPIYCTSKVGRVDPLSCCQTFKYTVGFSILCVCVRACVRECVGVCLNHSIVSGKKVVGQTKW